MKRLVDESTDELTRSLLRAGIEHRPPAANKRHVVIALGAGGVLGMFSSKALAWLGTTAGKVTATGVAVGVAAGVVARPWEAPSQDVSERGAPSVAAPSVVSTPPVPSGTEPSSAELAAPAVGQRKGAPSSAGELGPGGVEADPGEAAAGERRRLRSARTAKRRPARVSRPAAAEPAPEASGASSSEEREASARLAAEVRLVDEMHGAARRGDDAALVRAIEQYRASFPDGQLASEVDEFAARSKPANSR